MKIKLHGLGELNCGDCDNCRAHKNCYQYEILQDALSEGVVLYPTYYDHCLEGERADVERVTGAAYGMSESEWGENGFLMELDGESSEIYKNIFSWVSDNYGECEAKSPNYDLQGLARYLEEKLEDMNGKRMEKV